MTSTYVVGVAPAARLADRRSAYLVGSHATGPTKAVGETTYEAAVATSGRSPSQATPLALRGHRQEACCGSADECTRQPPSLVRLGACSLCTRYVPVWSLLAPTPLADRRSFLAGGSWRATSRGCSMSPYAGWRLFGEALPPAIESDSGLTRGLSSHRLRKSSTEGT
jgi:hypothetical protein